MEPDKIAKKLFEISSDTERRDMLKLLVQTMCDRQETNLENHLELIGEMVKTFDDPGNIHAVARENLAYYHIKMVYDHFGPEVLMDCLSYMAKDIPNLKAFVDINAEARRERG